MIFTFPTIYFWLKGIPLIIIKPYKEKVEQRRKELIEEYSTQNIKKLKDEYLAETTFEFKEIWEIEKMKEKPIKSLIAALLVLLIIFLIIFFLRSYTQGITSFFLEKV